MLLQYPQTDLTASNSIESFLLSFYEQLGWGRGTPLDPSKIIINPLRAEDILDAFEGVVGANHLASVMREFGPKLDTQVSYDAVEVRDGAFEVDYKINHEETAKLERMLADRFDYHDNTLHLTLRDLADTSFLEEVAWVARDESPELYQEHIRDEVEVVADEVIYEAYDDMAMEVANLRGNAGYNERLDDALEYLHGRIDVHYPFDEAFEHDLLVNIVIEDAGIGCASVPLREGEVATKWPAQPGAQTVDGALVWLAKHTGVSEREFAGAINCLYDRGMMGCRDRFGDNAAKFANTARLTADTILQTVLLVRTNVRDLPRVLDNTVTLTMPAGAVVAICAQGIKRQRIIKLKLDQELIVPPEIRVSLEAGSVGIGHFKTNAIGQDAWKSLVSIDVAARNVPLETLIEVFKERAGCRNAKLDNANTRHDYAKKPSSQER